MMIVMVVGFVLAWMPLNAVNLYRDLFGISTTKWYSTVFALCHVCAMCSAVLNPIIYSWFNPQFRTSITALFRGTDEALLKKEKQKPAQPPLVNKMCAYPSEASKETEVVSNKMKISIAENDYRVGDQLL
uniref:G_PROTEIN_RECEP_F1_2 domain-containing protein n=1 Tax=Caenorhabditis japonica TaxID=281687 RepID=A0A8R1HQG5_CAEJA